jgi:hypothetical protein
MNKRINMVNKVKQRKQTGVGEKVNINNIKNGAAVNSGTVPAFFAVPFPSLTVSPVRHGGPSDASEGGRHCGKMDSG